MLKRTTPLPRCNARNAPTESPREENQGEFNDSERSSDEICTKMQPQCKDRSETGPAVNMRRPADAPEARAKPVCVINMSPRTLTERAHVGAEASLPRAAKAHGVMRLGPAKSRDPRRHEMASDGHLRA